jgi:hypothetical protein
MSISRVAASMSNIGSPIQIISNAHNLVVMALALYAFSHIPVASAKSVQCEENERICVKSCLGGGDGRESVKRHQKVTHRRH